jgi:hypothetical protein
MKLLRRKRHNYKGINSAEVSVDYAAPNDIVQFHGEVFAKQFLTFAEKLPTLCVEGTNVFYYSDYAHIARRTDQYINSV